MSVQAEPSGTDRRSRGTWVTELLDRPDLVLRLVPACAVYVCVAQLLLSNGPRGPWGTAGWLTVVLAYLAQLALLLADRRWSLGWRALVVITLSPWSAIASSVFLVSTMPPAYWAYLVAPVLMTAAFACGQRVLGAATGLVTVAALALLVVSGLDLTRMPGHVVLLVVVWYAPTVLTRRVLGTMRQLAERLEEDAGRDLLTGTLNRQGLDRAVTRLLAPPRPRPFEWWRSRAQHADPAELAVVVVLLDDLRAVASRQGNTAAQDVVRDIGAALRRAFRGDHLSARLQEGSFVVVTTQDVGLLSDALLLAVRQAAGASGVTASIGIVAAVRADQVGPEDLGGLVHLAETQAAQVQDAGGDGVGIVPFVAEEVPEVLREVERPVVLDEDLVPPARSAHTTDPFLLGIGLTTTAVLASVAPRSAAASGGEQTVLLVASCLVAGLGVLVATRWVRSGVVHFVGVLLAWVVTSSTLATAGTPASLLVALALLAYPAYLAAMTLPLAWTSALGLVLPVAAWYGLTRAPALPPVLVRPTWVGMVGFGLVTAGLSVWVRRSRDNANTRLLRMARVDAMCGLLTRAGLVEAYRALPPGEDLAVVYLDVDDTEGLNARFGRHGTDVLLRRLAVVLHETAEPWGAAARVGGDEFVLLLTGDGREGAVPHLRARIAAEGLPLTVRTGQAFGVVEGDGALWRLVSAADEALMLNDVRARRGGVPGP